MTLPLSVIVVAYDIERELPRTLRSLSVGYQRDVGAADYEVIVVDNGSPTRVDPSVFDGLDGQFRLVRIDDASPSPAAAVNRGLVEARGGLVGVMVDGARLVTPGFIHYALLGSRAHPKAAVATLGWYLGYDFQRYALEAGWSKDDEDALLASIDWPHDGYRLFEISTLDESSVEGWFLEIFESNGMFLPSSVWSDLGGFDEVFDLPGGGLVNHDTLQRAKAIDDLQWVILLGEGTFHQVHGGIATNVTPEAIDEKMDRWREQYAEVRGRPVDPRPPFRDPVYLGTLPEVLWPRFGHAMNTMLRARKKLPATPPPVPLPDVLAEPGDLAAQLSARAATAASEGRLTEAQLFARQARVADPAARDVTPLLSCIATYRPFEELSRPERAQYFVDAGEACERAGASAEAEVHFRDALIQEPRFAAAYEGLSRLRMPGPGYYDRIRRIHEHLNPVTYLEIGVFTGESLALARPPTVAVAVDPDPQIREPIAVEAHIYRETSTHFFSQRDVRSLFGGRGPSLVFIDGLHEFPAVLEDFANVEAISDRNTILLLHDMIPYDELTQRAERVHEFYTGDVWKVLHCLADVRPDLSWFTIRTPPSGLTVVGGLDSTSTVLRDQYDKLVERFASLTFEDASDVPGPVLDNDWAVVSESLDRIRAASSPAKLSGPSGSLTATNDTERLARRVRELEAVDAERRKELAALKRQRREGALGVLLDPESAQAQLEALQNTKLVRWTRPLRAAYSRLRGRSRSV